MALMKFNRSKVQYGRKIEQPSEELIRNTLALHNASLEDAIKYGGELTRAALDAMDLTFSKKYIVVDTKIHMLMPGMSPAIPGWHTDGVPRGSQLDPQFKGRPDIKAQETLDSPIFHLLVTGDSCLTEFVEGRDIVLDVPSEPSTKLYSSVSKQMRDKISKGELTSYPIASCTAVSWDWWELHTGVQATKHEWRFLIRVTETNIQPPKTKLRDIIRTQQQIYSPVVLGW